MQPFPLWDYPQHRNCKWKSQRCYTIKPGPQPAITYKLRFRIRKFVNIFFQKVFYYKYGRKQKIMLKQEQRHIITLWALVNSWITIFSPVCMSRNAACRGWWAMWRIYSDFAERPTEKDLGICWSITNWTGVSFSVRSQPRRPTVSSAASKGVQPGRRR